MKPDCVCYWLIGSGKSLYDLPPAVAIDVHAENGDLIGATRSFYLAELDEKISKREMLRRAKAKAAEIAAKIELKASALFYDADSTVENADC